MKEESEFEKAIREAIEQRQESIPEFNGNECRNGCNCAQVAMGGDELAFDKIKNGYTCLKPVDYGEEKQVDKQSVIDKINAFRDLIKNNHEENHSNIK